MQFEPGIDRHEWESEWQALEEELSAAPAEALPEAAALAERMLIQSGYDIADPVAREGEEREVVAEYLAAREVANRLEAGATVDPGDIGSAIQGLRALRDLVIHGNGGS
ncbi:MAG: hypothetical protein ABR583_13270 [Gaiellaceae bacterium]